MGQILGIAQFDVDVELQPQPELLDALADGLAPPDQDRSRQPLLLWSACCFSLLAVNNLLLFLDRLVLREVDLGPARVVTALLAVGVLLYGFIWEVDR